MMTKKITEKNRVLKMMFLAILFSMALPVDAQEDPEKVTRNAKKYMQQAEEALAENDAATAEAFYRKAIAIDPANAEARYNLGNLYYNKEITRQAVERHGQAANVAEKKDLKHDSFHNRGNAFMKEKKYQEAIEAYKNSLRNNPSDDETRYNLALAKKMLEEEKKKGGGDSKNNKDQQDQNQDQKKDNKDQQGDKGDKEQNEEGKPEEKDKGGEEDKKDEKKGDDKKDDKGDPKKPENQEKGDKQKDQPQQPQPRPGQLSPQQVKNLLEAMGNEEKKIQDKINAEKAKGVKRPTEKDW